MTKNQKSEALFTDCLCYESFFSVGLFTAFKMDWYFTSESMIFFPFRRFLERFISVKFICLDSISYGDEHFDEVSLYECMQQETKEIIRLFIASEVVSEKIDSFSKEHSYNISKVHLFLSVHYYPYLYRLIELKVLIRHLRIERSRIVLKNSPVSNFITTLDIFNVSNYRMLFSNFFQIKKRENYYFDITHVMLTYYKSRRIFFFLEILKKLRLIFYLVSSKSSPNKRWEEKSLAIELVQRRLNFSETNDLFFTHNEELNDSDCCLIEEQIYTGHYDSDSYEVIKLRDFKRIKIFDLKTTLKQQRIDEIDKSYTTVSLVKIIGISRFLKHISELIGYLFVFSTNKQFLSFLLKQYDFDCYVWDRIYKKFSIKILWSMLDGGYQQASKSQAIELNEGLYAGSHWSNYPMLLVNTYKPHDIFFPWSEHFKELFEIDTSPIESHIVGYISTDYFKLFKESLPNLRKEYPGKIIITFNDNVFYNDISISESSYDEFYSLATRILEQNDDVIIFIKPKRKELFRKKVKSYQRLNDFIKQGRARLFFSDNDRSKIPPAKLAIESDLVIGLGISTTTLEAIIAKTPSLNLNFCNFPNNKFSQSGLDTVVFSDRSKIYKEIKGLLKQHRKLSMNNQEEYYQILDPFLDEKSGERIAKKLSNLLNRTTILDTLHS